MLEEYLPHVIVIVGIYFITQAIKIRVARQKDAQTASNLAFYLVLMLGLVGAGVMSWLNGQYFGNLIPMIFIYIGVPMFLNATGTKLNLKNLPKIGVLFQDASDAAKR